ncbi:MAG TPA: amidohydrolase family protein, partial [Candidatus Sutterella merdavium]|nr:amidohydrolase family protein [Candidatus Sutterella merdavium]
MITIDAARAIGREADLGTLEAGKLADITTINMTSPHLMPRLMPIHQLMLYGNTGDVADVFVAGKALMLDRRVLTVSEADVFECAQTASLEAIHRAGYERLLTPADNFWTGAQSNISALREP